MKLLPTYQEYKKKFPLSAAGATFIHKARQILRAILNGTDQRLLLIIGPCSIHDVSSAIEYAKKLKELATAVSPYFFIIIRAYCEKPRTATGWKGLLYDPLLDDSHEIQLGLELTRQLLLELANLQIPVAVEFLDPLAANYYDDLVTWGSIGARTSSSQIHRQLASHLNMPIGFKNGVAGNISVAIDGAIVASHSQTYLGISEEGKIAILSSNGNLDTHIILRGGQETGPNYDPASINRALSKLKKAGLPARLLVDCSHHNSNKNHQLQINVFQSVLNQYIEGNNQIRGLMLESFLYAGNQSLLDDRLLLKYGISITDSCLDWASTAQLITWACDCLSKQFSFRT